MHVDLKVDTNVLENILPYLQFSPEDWGNMFLQNIHTYLQIHMASQPEEQK